MILNKIFIKQLFKHLIFIFVTCSPIGIRNVNCEPKRVKFNEVSINPDGDGFTIIKNNNDNPNQRILIGVVIKNHEYSLPTFLATLETLKCPNELNKCDLWFVFDKSYDSSFNIVKSWSKNTKFLFNSIELVMTSKDEEIMQNNSDLNGLYFSKNLKLRALKYALDKKFNYLFFTKADNILTNPNTIEILINKKKTIVAPLLNALNSYNSNFILFDMNTYESIFDRKITGCHLVESVHDTYLIDLDDVNVEKLLSYNETFDMSDDSYISEKALNSNILLHVCNRENFGLIPDTTNTMINFPKDNFIHLRTEYLLSGPNNTYNKPLPLSQKINPKFLNNKKTKMGFDEIYVINLERRPDRREVIESTLNDLGLAYKMTKAVDGKKIDSEFLKKLGIEVLPDYKDPYSDRPMTYGEIGCFLSHYNIWKDMVENNYEKVIIFEDDSRFESNFRRILESLLDQMDRKEIKWDLLYLGRKILEEYYLEETWEESIKSIEGHGIMTPSYTYWTVSYALTLEGAKKLLNENPLKNILPVDEYLPIMFNAHPNKYWNSFFKNRNLIAKSIQPLIIKPTYYKGQTGYVSDTEESNIIDDKKDILIYQEEDYKIENEKKTPILDIKQNILDDIQSHFEL